jgi:rare lipoprotein A
VLALALAAATTMVTTGLAGAQTQIPADGPVTAGTDPAAVTKVAKMRSQIVLRVKRHVLSGHLAVARGRVWPHLGHRTVTVRLSGRKVRTVRVSASGRFRIRWRAPRAGVYHAVAIAHRTGAAKADRSRRKRVNVYRPAEASYYGPGLYGNGMACGGTLEPGTMGVANKTLPCGSKVTLRYRGRTVTVRVVDRGPYAAGRDYDLTEATKSKLHFGAVGTVLATR